ncbi:MAG: hypothetical protein K6D38_12060 [Pseudobutyrivibrio sp.]|nr:hypothetical protein [Pseudobutyrivibrio sp.]
MIIQNSEVQMTSKSSYSAATKVNVQITQTPALKIGNSFWLKTDGISTTEAEKKFGGLTVDDGGGGFLSSLNYALSPSGDVQEVGDSSAGEIVSANRQTRLQTLDYLFRLLIYGKLFEDNSEFKELFNEIFWGNSGYMETVSTSYEYTEIQSTSFSATGSAMTADGRQLSFEYGFEMSESFHEEFQSVESRYRNFIDPLVVNLSDSPTKISDQRFYFDLDGDGSLDEINQLQPGSGFLALDRNGDGEINDGKELFGAKTGDGFKELALFDEDHNGWIDENDSIFNKLRIWSMNEEGEMELYTLQHSDVGAIYLGRVNTEFVNHDSEHEARAAIRESGIFLHESDGHAGGVQHVDFAT